MLHPKHNRIDYGDQLIPPDGYELSYAVGTSYSLDLEALMILPVALFYAQKIEGNTDELRYDMLEAITRVPDKISVYYQNGQLKVPQKYHYLMAYWEQGIQPVTMPGHAQSFHPKVWVIRFEHKQLPAIYRVMISSRNLTFVRDWDVAFATDGKVADKIQQENTPLIHFLQYLDSKGNKPIPKKFMEELSYVKFDLHDKFDTFSFMPVGIPNTRSGKQYKNPITMSSWDELLIISPFLDNTTLRRIHSITEQKPYLLSRKEELDAIDEPTLALFDCWQFATFFERAEYFQELEEDGALPQAQQLHAKLFVGMKGNRAHWYLGSANCSGPAQERNVEFMIGLEAANGKGLKTEDIFKNLTDLSKTDNITLFEEYDNSQRVSVAEQKSIEIAIRKIKYDVTKLVIKGTVELIEGGSAYELYIDIDAAQLTLPVGYQVKVKPLPEQQKAPVLIQAAQQNTIDHFGGYTEAALSIFLIFEIAKDDTVYSRFLLPMEIKLPANRLNKIFTAIIDSRDKFLQYLTFLLTGEETGIIKNIDKQQNKHAASPNETWAFMGTPVYEKLLIATSRFPGKLQSVDALIQRLKAETTASDEPIITAEFEGFWSTFQTFIKNK